MKPYLLSQISGSLWEELYLKQDYANILSRYNATSIGIVPQSIKLDRKNSDDIELYKENELTVTEKNNILSQISLCDGIILQGGLSSHKYEVFIAHYAIEHNIPILGICAGFNNIARAIGTEVEYNQELAKKHDIYDSKPSHNAKICKGGIFDNVLTENNIKVNSIHTMTLNKSIAQQNKRILVEVISEDSEFIQTVEAFSVKDTKFCLAIKWHPELLPNDKMTNLIFQQFCNACEQD